MPQMLYDRFMNAVNRAHPILFFIVRLFAVAFFFFSSLTWPSMCCIYVTNSVMLIFEKEKEKECECGLKRLRTENGWFIRLRSFICMQAIYRMQLKNAHGL